MLHNNIILLHCISSMQKLAGMDPHQLQPLYENGSNVS